MFGSSVTSVGDPSQRISVTLGGTVSCAMAVNQSAGAVPRMILSPMILSPSLRRPWEPGSSVDGMEFDATSVALASCQPRFHRSSRRSTDCTGWDHFPGHRHCRDRRNFDSLFGQPGYRDRRSARPAMRDAPYSQPPETSRDSSRNSQDPQR